MPLYEYSCRACGYAFEALVRGLERPPCPACGGTELDRLLSSFAVDSATTRDAARQKSMPRSIRRQQEKERADLEDWKRRH